MLDLYIKNGRTIDDETIEIGIKQGKIVAIEKKLDVVGEIIPSPPLDLSATL